MLDKLPLLLRIIGLISGQRDKYRPVLMQPFGLVNKSSDFVKADFVSIDHKIRELLLGALFYQIVDVATRIVF